MKRIVVPKRPLVGPQSGSETRAVAVAANGESRFSPRKIVKHLMFISTLAVLAASAPLQAQVQVKCHGKTVTLSSVGGMVTNGGVGDDVIEGTSGNDTINGNGGNDTICGRDGHDMIKGGDGDDHLYGGLGNDELFGDDGQDHLIGQDGVDSLNGGPDNDFFSCGADADVAEGSTGLNDVLGPNHLCEVINGIP